MQTKRVPNQYGRSTLVGNWAEDQALYSHRVQEYTERKNQREAEEAAAAAVGARDDSAIPAGAVLAGGVTKLSHRANGNVYSGDAALIMSISTSGLLTVNSLGDDFCATLRNKGPIPANTFLIVSADASAIGNAEPQPLRFGRPIRIQVHPAAASGSSSPYGGSNSHSAGSVLYLSSAPISLTTTLKHKRQQLSVCSDPNADTLWRLDPRFVDERLPLDGEPVSSETEVMIVHVATGQPLICEKGENRGPVWLVEAALQRTAGKRQVLDFERKGLSTIDLPRFEVSDSNSWTLLLGSGSRK